MKTRVANGAVAIVLTGVLIASAVLRPQPAAAFPDQTSAVQPAAQTAGSVVVNEFVASNQSGLQDEDGDYSDWIELYNPGAAAISLAGWSLSDDPGEPGKWLFPAITVPANGYLVIIASEKDRAPLSGQLHTNFRLSAAGEYLGLFDGSNPRQIIDQFSPQFPAQYSDISYGRYSTPGEYRYFSHPTPGAVNDSTSAYLGVVADVSFSVPRGFYDQPLFVTLSTDTPGASIRYTTSGSAPTETTGRPYTSPIGISSSMPLRAIAYKAGYLPTEVATHTYIFLDQVIAQPINPYGFPTTWGTYGGDPTVADYEMDPDVVRDPRYRDTIENDLRSAPTLSLVTARADMFDENIGIYANPMQEGDAWEKPASLELIYPDGSTAFQVNAGVRIHGGRSRIPTESAKHSFRVYFRSIYGFDELNFPIFDGLAVDEFQVLVLRGFYGDSWMQGSSRGLYLRDQWMRDVQNDMGHHGSHGVYVHLYVNGLYWGLYDISERVDEHFAESYYGGAAEEFDVIKALHWGTYYVAQGNALAWDTVIGLASQDLSIPANYAAVQQYVDMVDLIDYMLTHFYSGTEAEWPGLNWIAMRRRAPDEKFRFVNWDIELTLRDVNINNLNVGPLNSPAYLYAQLRANAEFRLLFADRVHYHFFNNGALSVDPNYPQWDPAHPERNVPAARFVQRANEIERAMVGESARWGDWYFGWLARKLDDNWIPERNWLLDEFFPQRSTIVLQQLRNAGLYPTTDAPAFSQHGGSVPAGYRLGMSAPSGTIYFTTDGSDPRVPGTSIVATSATAYGSPFALPGGVTPIKARVLDGSTWSALNEATFEAPQDWSTLKLTEIMYNPLGGSAYEFLELKNTGTTTLNMAGVQITNGVDFVFRPGSTLAPGQLNVLINDDDPASFSTRYPGVSVTGWFTRELSNGGDTVTLLDPQGATILTASYDDAAPWPTAPDGHGYSLVIVDPNASANEPTNWRASSFIYGSPGEDDPPPVGGVINEILAHSDLPFEDAIELHNPTATTVDIGGWFLSDDAADPEKFRIPDGTTIAPDGYQVFYEYQFNPNPGVLPSFALSSTGETLFLVAAEPGGATTGVADRVAFDASPTNTAIGRFAASTGVHFTTLSRTTFGADNPSNVQQFRTGAGAANAYPLVGPIVIHELMYNPAAGHEFVELRNITNAPVPLYDPTNTANTWKFLDGITFEFPTGVVVPARGLALVAPIDPATFAATYHVPLDVPVFGPYTGALNNDGEKITLGRPDTPNGGVVPYLPVDSITYNNAAPWPTAPNGSGPSLERLSGPTYANDPVLWAASAPGGTPGRDNNACFLADVHPNKNHTQPSLCDDDVDIADLQTVAGCWSQPLAAANCPATLNIDGVDAYFTVNDIIASAGYWGWRR